MRKSLALLILSVLPTLAMGQYSAQPLQRCKLEVNIVGDGQYHLEQGHDSWTGKGTIECRAGTVTSNREMTVVFNSNIGRGLNASSVIHLSVSLLTTVPLDLLLVELPVTATTSGETMSWVIETTNVHADIALLNVTADFSPSLERGWLRIH